MLHKRCQRIKDWIARDSDIAGIWTEMWGHNNLDRSLPNSIDEWFDALVESHSRCRLLEVFQGFADTTWKELWRTQREWDGLLASQFESLDAGQRYAISRHLRFYRHVTLEASWLALDWDFMGPDSVDGLSAVRRITYSDNFKAPSVDNALDRLELNEEVREEASRVLDKLAQTVWEFGFTCLSEDALSPDLRPGSSTPLGSPSLIVNPKPPKLIEETDETDKPIGRIDSDTDQYRVAMSAIQVADTFREDYQREELRIELDRIILCMSRPRGVAWARFSRVLVDLHGYISSSNVQPDLVIAITDTWDSERFRREHHAECVRHAAAGVQFLFLLAGSPDRRLSRIEIDL